MHQLQRIALVKPWEVHAVWRLVEDELAKALIDSYHQSTDQWLRDCMDDKAQLWLGEKCSAITEVREGRPRVLHILALAGENMDEWLDDMIAAWRDFARSAECKIMVASGRPGWRREFKRHGFAVTKITGVCEV